MKINQCQRIIQYIQTFGSISTMEAFSDLGVTRLASRIHDLRRQGYNIVSEIKTGKNRFEEAVSFKVYSLAEKGGN